MFVVSNVCELDLCLTCSQAGREKSTCRLCASPKFDFSPAWAQKADIHHSKTGRMKITSQTDRQEVATVRFDCGARSDAMPHCKWRRFENRQYWTCFCNFHRWQCRYLPLPFWTFVCMSLQNAATAPLTYTFSQPNPVRHRLVNFETLVSMTCHAAWHTTTTLNFVKLLLYVWSFTQYADDMILNSFLFLFQKRIIFLTYVAWFSTKFHHIQLPLKNNTTKILLFLSFCWCQSKVRAPFNCWTKYLDCPSSYSLQGSFILQLPSTSEKLHYMPVLL